MDGNINYEVRFIGDVDPTTGFGLSDGKIKLHIYAQDISQQGEPIVAGNAPFIVKLKLNGEIVHTSPPIDVCVDPANLNLIPENGPVEFNYIVDVPMGIYDIEIIDSIGNDARGHSVFNVVSPPIVLLDSIINPNNSETVVSFEFGETTEYGSEVAFTPINGSEPVHCKLELHSQGCVGDPTSVLLPGTTYHYRAKAVNEFGTTYGEDMTFTTLTYEPVGMAPTIQTLQATIIA